MMTDRLNRGVARSFRVAAVSLLACAAASCGSTQGTGAGSVGGENAGGAGGAGGAGTGGVGMGGADRQDAAGGSSGGAFNYPSPLDFMRMVGPDCEVFVAPSGAPCNGAAG